MKTLFSFPFGSFRFSILIYILVAVTIPLLLAALFFYNQTGVFVNKEQKKSLNQMHIQILQRFQSELHHVETVSDTIKADYAVQKYVQGLGPDDSTELQEYINGLLNRELAEDFGLDVICLISTSQGSMICAHTASNQELNQMFEPEINNTIAQSFSPYSNGVRYTIPIKASSSGVIEGEIAVELNFNSFIHLFSLSTDQAQISFYDQMGKLLYVSDSDPAENGAKMITSEKRLNYANLQWSSKLTEYYKISSSSLFWFRNLLLGILIVLIGISLVSSLLYSQYLMKPLLHLQGLMKRAELGDLKAYWTMESMREMNELGYSYNQMLNHIEELIKQVKHEAGLKRDAEIKALQYQLNPHFLYNTLNTIKWVAKIHKTPQISEVVTALVLLLQSSLGKRGDFITLQEESQLVEAYMAIQFFRYGEQIDMVIEMDELSRRCLVPRMILQPLVENAILHGLKPMKRKGRIIIKAWIDRDLLFCQVEDNGIGMPHGLYNADGEEAGTVKMEQVFPIQHSALRQSVMKERMSGIGIRHIREKIKLYYGADYKMHIFSEERPGTRVRISLPIHPNEDFKLEGMR